MMTRKSLCLLSLIVAGLPAFGQTVDNVLKIEYAKTSTFKKSDAPSVVVATSETKYYAPDGTVRTETVDNAHHKKTVELTNEAEDYLITIDEEHKLATRLNGSIHANHANVNSNVGNKVPLGSSSIQGFSCQGYSNSFGDGLVLKHWFCKDPATGTSFLGRVEGNRQFSTTEQTIVNLTRGASVPVSLFQIPRGYTVAVMDAGDGISAFKPGR